MKYSIDQEPPTLAAIKADLHPKRMAQIALTTATLVTAASLLFIDSANQDFARPLLGVFSIALIVHSLYFLGQLATPISPAQCEEVILWRGRSPLIDQYVKKVAEQNRELVHPEYCMLLKHHNMEKHVSAKSRLYKNQ